MIRKSRLISASRFSTRPIPGYDGYAATSEGRIVKLFDEGRMLAVLSEHFRFGLRVAITFPDGSETTAPVGKLVALAFHPGGPGDVCFRDGNQRNTHPDNVFWDVDTVPIEEINLSDLRPAPNVPEVFVTADGNVYSRRSSHGDGLLRKLKGSVDDKGYLRVKLIENGKTKFIGIHRLICEAFNGPSPGAHKPHVCHRNDNKSDNRAENLYWGSDLDNHKDAVRNGKAVPYGTGGKTGTVHRGEKAGRAVFTEDTVRKIRRRNAVGETYAALSKEYDVHPNSIRLICLRKTWAHVE